MFVSKVPHRISLVGGGSDFPEFFRKEGGSVIGLSIDKYCLVVVNKKRDCFQDYKIRLVYSKMENVMDIDEIRHPLIKEALRLYGCEEIEIYHLSEVPSRAGLGSSSAFAVALLGGLRMFNNLGIDLYSMAKEAYFLERVILGESGGLQDQAWGATSGAWNRINFCEEDGEDCFDIVSLNYDFEEIESWMLLIFTGIMRDSFVISSDQEKRIEDKFEEYRKMKSLVDDMDGALEKGNIIEVGNILRKAWEIKKGFSPLIDTKNVSDLVSVAKKFGSVGEKLLGAGGGGCVLIIAPPDSHESILENLPDICVKIPVKRSSGFSCVEI